MAIRQVFTSFCLALVGFGVVIALLYGSSNPPAHPPAAAIAILIVLSGLGGLLGRGTERPLICESDETLRGSYRMRFFLRIAFAEQSALFGFVGFFLTYAWWPYPAGVALAALGFARAAPTRANLAQDEADLRGQGCGRSLVQALRGGAGTS